MRIKNTGWRRVNQFRKRTTYSTPDLYDIKYIDGEQLNTYQFEDIKRTCNLCRRDKLTGLFYCQIPAKIAPMKTAREEFIINQSVCILCANRMGI